MLEYGKVHRIIFALNAELIKRYVLTNLVLQRVELFNYGHFQSSELICNFLNSFSQFGEEGEFNSLQILQLELLLGTLLLVLLLELLQIELEWFDGVSIMLMVSAHGTYKISFLEIHEIEFLSFMTFFLALQVFDSIGCFRMHFLHILLQVRSLEINQYRSVLNYQNTLIQQQGINNSELKLYVKIINQFIGLCLNIALMYPKKSEYAKLKTNKKPINMSKTPTTPFNKTASTRQIVYQNRQSPIRKQADARQRLGSRSIQFQEFYQNKSDMRSQQLQQHENEEQVQLFGKSNRKLAAIKDLFGSNKTMELELCEVLKLIKEEKNKIYDTINQLKDVSDYYKNLAQNKHVYRIQTASNTEDMLPLGLDVILSQKSIQTDNQQIEAEFAQDIKEEISKQSKELLSQQENPNCGEFAVQTQIQTRNDDKNQDSYNSPTKNLSEQHESQLERQNQHISEPLLANQKETYQKLAKMLSDMNIDYKNILPEGLRIDIPVKDWKQLSETEIIKIQQYFIKKLVQKIKN